MFGEAALRRGGCGVQNQAAAFETLCLQARNTKPTPTVVTYLNTESIYQHHLAACVLLQYAGKFRVNAEAPTNGRRRL